MYVIEYIMGVFLNVVNIFVWVMDYLFNNNIMLLIYF